MVDEDIVAGWASIAEAGKERRAKNRVSSRQVLTDAGIAFEEKNIGAHLIVTHEKVTVDFWPGTGLWHVRHSSKKGRGVFGLVRHLQKGA